MSDESDKNGVVCWNNADKFKNNEMQNVPKYTYWAVFILTFISTYIIGFMVFILPVIVLMLLMKGCGAVCQ